MLTTLQPADAVEIHQLYARQSRAIDGGDAEGWAGTFTEGGTFDSPSYGPTVVGRAELTAFALRFAERAAAEGRSYRHWTNAILLDAQGADAVTATGYLAIVVIEAEQQPRFERHTEITDRLARTTAGWRFESRVVTRTAGMTPTKE